MFVPSYISNFALKAFTSTSDISSLVVPLIGLIIGNAYCSGFWSPVTPKSRICLLFTFSKEEVEFTRRLFLDAYTCNIEELTHLLIDGSNQKDVDVTSLMQDFQKCCSEFKNIPVPQFFMNMMFVYTKYNLEPDPIFYKMAKAFVALFGINTFTENIKSTEELLMQQIVDFYVSRTINDVKEITEDGITFLPNFIKNTLEKGLTKSIAEQIISLSNFSKKVNESVKHFDEVLSFFK